MTITRTLPKTFTRLRDLTKIPKSLQSIDRSFFIETADGLALGRGLPLRYTLCPLDTLVDEPLAYRNKIITSRLTVKEAELLVSRGFTATQQGDVKVWQKD